MPELAEGYRDLLLVLSVPGLYCLMVLLGRYLKRRQGVRLGWLYHFFALCVAVYAPARLLDLSWPFLHHLGAAAVILSATLIIPLVDRYIWDLHFQRHLGITVPKFLTELVSILVIVIAVFLVLEFGYGQTIKGLLLAPGIAAVVLGFGMQDLMSSLVAGLSLQAGRSFRQGDWLLLDNRYAEVMDINWRSTRFRTLDDISVEIPNREINRLTLVNLTRPERTHAIRISFLLDYDTPPTRAKNVLHHAVANARGVCPEPKPRVYLKNFGDSGVEYEIKLWLTDPSQLSEVTDAVRTNVWYGLRRHGIPIPYPTRTVFMERPARGKTHETQSAARDILRQQPLFRCLRDEDLDALLPRGKVVHFGSGEPLIRQGDPGDSMFILVHGEATVIAQRNGATRELATLKAGDCFGEMSLLTGEPRSATITAKTDCVVVEIDKEILSGSLRQNPALLSQLSDLLARRQMHTEGVLATEAQTDTAHARQTRYAANFLDKIQAFFDL
jgi:small-conductance mechanosensitive channel/CRP-like cAMP-binding protein